MLVHYTLLWRMKQLRSDDWKPVVIVGYRASKTLQYCTSPAKTRRKSSDTITKEKPPSLLPSLPRKPYLTCPQHLLDTWRDLHFSASLLLLKTQYINQGRHNLKARHVDIRSSLFCVHRIHYPRSSISRLSILFQESRASLLKNS